MSFTGCLDDVSVCDVLQFIHLGGRSGTLSLAWDERAAEIGFHRGRIISARGPDHVPLGEWLLIQGAIQPGDIEAALRVQKRLGSKVAIGKVLVEMGALSVDSLKQQVERQIEHTVYDLVSWTGGTFEFELDELRPIDDLSMSPGDIIPDININTQMVLLEAARIIDERSRDGQRNPQPAARTESGDFEREHGDEGEPEERNNVEALPVATRVPTRVQIVSSDASLQRKLQLQLDDKRLDDKRLAATVVPARDAGSRLPGEQPPVVLVDLRAGDAALELLSSIRRMRPRATLIGITSDPSACGEAFERGVIALAPPEAEVIAACLHNVVRLRDDGADAEHSSTARMRGITKLCRAFGEFRSGLLNATVSLNLMSLVSESVERAVLFVAAPTRLVVLGAYGTTEDGRPLAQHTRQYQVPLEAAGVLAESLRDARTRTLAFDNAALPAAFAALIGRPVSGSFTIFPLLGSRKVIATLYVDNGRKHTPIDDVEFLEVATAHVGMYYENELLRRQLQATTNFTEARRA